MSEGSTNNVSSGVQTIKDVVLIFGVISALILLNKLFGKKTEDEEHDSTEDEARKSRDELYKTIPPSFQSFVYRDFADMLDKALLRGAMEDEDPVYEIFSEFKNISDLNKTIDAFGHRREMFTTYYITLPQAITTLFTASEKRKLNTILKERKIEYKFM